MGKAVTAGTPVRAARAHGKATRAPEPPSREARPTVTGKANGALTGEIKNLVDRVWDAFWSGGIANPLEVVEQITYLLFLRRLDDLQTLEGNRARALGARIERRIFPVGKDAKGRPYEDYRWSRLKNLAPDDMFTVVADHVFPWLRTLGGEDSTYAQFMKDAYFRIPTAALLDKVVDLLDGIPMDDRDTKGDLYEYLLSEIATAGKNGQFRTPRHIIRLMVEMVAPRPNDIICDPACGTAGFLVTAGEYLRERHPDILRDAKPKKHFNTKMFHGFDFDHTMLRIASMNMLLHGVNEPDIRYRDSLAEEYATDEEAYTLVLANPPFSGSLDEEHVAKDLLRTVGTRQTELLFIALFLRLLKAGGRAAVVVPEGVLFSTSRAHREVRRLLVEEQKLEAVISLPSGVFRPYAGVSTGIVVFTKTNSGGTRDVWFYDVTSDGWSLDDRRVPLLPKEKLGPCAQGLDSADLERNNLADVLMRWRDLAQEETRPRTAQSFRVARDEIARNGYDLTYARYRTVVHQEQQHASAKEVLAQLAVVESSISERLQLLRQLL